VLSERQRLENAALKALIRNPSPALVRALNTFSATEFCAFLAITSAVPGAGYPFSRPMKGKPRAPRREMAERFRRQRNTGPGRDAYLFAVQNRRGFEKRATDELSSWRANSDAHELARRSADRILTRRTVFQPMPHGGFTSEELNVRRPREKDLLEAALRKALARPIARSKLCVCAYCNRFFIRPDFREGRFCRGTKCKGNFHARETMRRKRKANRR
jgi:hypothetical protein